MPRGDRITFPQVGYISCGRQRTEPRTSSVSGISDALIVLPQFRSDTLVLLSSDAQPRYADDIIRVLALAPGLQTQFRYDTRLIESSVVALAQSGQLSGEAAVVCYVTPGGEHEQRQFIPVRHVTIMRAEIVGSTCVLTIEARNYVTGLSSDFIRRRTTDEVRAALPQFASADAEGANSELLAFFSAFEVRRYADREMAAFQTTADMLARFRPFSTPGTTFYTVYRLSKAALSSLFARTSKPLRAEGGVYRLRSGSRYELEIYVYAPTAPAEGLKLTASAESDVVGFVSRPVVAIDSRYDLKSLILATRAELWTRPTGVSLQFIPGADGPAHPPRDISLRLLVRGRFLIGAAKALVVTCGTTGPAALAALAADKLTPALALSMVLFGAVAGIGSVFIASSKA